MSAWEQLADLIPPEQREALADLLRERLVDGWGEVVVVFHNGHIDGFLSTRSVRAPRPKAAVVVNSST